MNEILLRNPLNILKNTNEVGRRNQIILTLFETTR